MCIYNSSQICLSASIGLQHIGHPHNTLAKYTLVYYSDVCDTNMHSFGMIQLSQTINHRLNSYVIKPVEYLDTIISVPELHYTAYIS